MKIEDLDKWSERQNAKNKATFDSFRETTRGMTWWDWFVVLTPPVTRFFMWLAVGATIAKVWWPR